MKSYRRIAAVKTTVSVLKFLAEQRQPVSGQAVAHGIDVKYDSVMCHLASLEDEGLVQSIGGDYKLGMAMAMFWAKMKSHKESDRCDIERDVRALETGSYNGRINDGIS